MKDALLKVVPLIAKAYVCHILVFTAGAICGAIEAFTILAVMWGPR